MTGPRETGTRPAHPRRSARVRLAVLYGGLFLASGTVLLLLTNLFSVTQSAPVGAGPALRPMTLVEAQQQIAGLEAQLVEQQSDQARLLVTASVSALALMALASIVLGLVVARRVLRPLRTITAATRRISADNLHQRLAVTGPEDEVKELGDTIDDLLDRLEQSFATQRRFVANAAHELRTPLATMRASMDVAIGKPGPIPAPTIALADRFRVELDRVDRLLESFLMLARVQLGGLPDPELVALSGLAADALRNHAPDAVRRGLQVETGLTTEAAWTTGSPTLLAQMVENLVGNAITHNVPGGWVRVLSGTDTTTATLIIESGGPLLDAEDVAGLSQPFRRIGADRIGSERGSGLGLSIVEAIALAHGGRLELSARADGGLRVAISLPLSTAPAGVPR